MKLGLGTAQFGLDYGISNRSGVTPLAEVGQILRYARERGITLLDTAPAYGDSETALGRSGCQGMRVVTKVPKGLIAGHMKGAVKTSLERLGTSRLYGLLFHSPTDLLGEGGEGLLAEARDLQRSGLVEKVGVSIYTAEEIDSILSKFDVDLIQVPLSVLDQRLPRGGYLKKLKSRGVEIHARSVFLQGLLLMDPKELDPFFEPALAHLKKIRELATRNGTSPLEVGLRYALGLDEIDEVICGVNSLQQLRALVAIADSPAPGWARQLDGLAYDDTRILNPSQWQLKERKP